MIVILIAILLSLNSGLSKILNKKAVQESILKGKSSTTKLVFCRENIDFIEPDSFYGKYEVTILEIPYNKLRNLKGDLLRDTRKLEEANFADKRVVKIFLTELGKQKRDQAKQGVLIFNDLIYQRIGEEKLADFFKVIGSINKILDEESDTIFESVSNKLKQ